TKLIDKSIDNLIAAAIGGGTGSGAGGGVISAFTSLFSAGTGAPLSLAPAGIGHAGGMVAALPRLHAGGLVGSDERVVVAKAGEEIGWPGQLARKYGGPPVQIINMTGQPSRAETARAPDGRAFVRVIVGEARREIMRDFAGGGFDPVMRGRFGVGVQHTQR
ncbi:MAG TPA: hypothetical protein VIH40_09370, partial [Xanthobacteraceae bacterium]